MAKLDFFLRTEHYKAVPDYKVYQNQGQFKSFNSAMIAGISAIIDPRGHDGDTMRKILGGFLEMNPWSEVKDKDEMTRKEVQIVSSRIRRLMMRTYDAGGWVIANQIDTNVIKKSCTDIREFFRSRRIWNS